MRFTKGPWFVGPHYTNDVESREGRICECGPRGSSSAIANSQAISALPDLYDALMFVLVNSGDPIMERVARQAIEKANGRSDA